MTVITHDSTLEPGLTLLRTPSRQSAAVHRLVCEYLADIRASPERPDRPPEKSATGDGLRGRAYWIDAGNVASTHALYECAPGSGRALERLRIARAFTAYQHHSLVQAVVRRADADTPLVVAPNVASLYQDGDLREWERTDLLASTLAVLGELGRGLECPVVITSGPDVPGATVERLEAAADSVVECTRTREGLRFEGAGFETMGYWHGPVWQTTIPYWVDLFGTVDPERPWESRTRTSHPSIDPLEGVLA
ncbi:hypothetical protein [Natronosalvus rutilus]|uniref:Uncharacterized protein n=1 Tax=Natronosalvus rutilus TaxID=2953753 RepID=A0A9E7N9I6_9EURY|nr:hypothetical protein [Natronosalvus rutilus]UTF53301.1 hypothetical protein NGM29_16260 [Natronosalvus rutilus]